MELFLYLHTIWAKIHFSRRMEKSSFDFENPYKKNGGEIQNKRAPTEIFYFDNEQNPPNRRNFD